MSSEKFERVARRVSSLISHEKPARRLWESLVGRETERVQQIVDVIRDFPLNEGDLLWMTAGGSLVAKGKGNDIDLKVFTQGRGITERLERYLEAEFSNRKIEFVKAESPAMGVLENETRPVIWLPRAVDKGEAKPGERPIHLILPYGGDLGVSNAKQMHSLGLQSKAWVELLDRAGKIVPMIEYGTVGSSEEKQKAYGLRFEVFVREQKVPEDMELDEFDAGAIHAIAKDGEAVVGTGRLVIEGDRGRIGRMAVQKERRREGIGGGLMEVLENKARELGLTEIYLHAQVHAKDFYAKRGYLPRGEEFDEAGITHIAMYKTLK